MSAQLSLSPALRRKIRVATILSSSALLFDIYNMNQYGNAMFCFPFFGRHWWSNDYYGGYDDESEMAELDSELDAESEEPLQEAAHPKAWSQEASPGYQRQSDVHGIVTKNPRDDLLAQYNYHRNMNIDIVKGFGAPNYPQPQPAPSLPYGNTNWGPYTNRPSLPMVPQYQSQPDSTEATNGKAEKKKGIIYLKNYARVKNSRGYMQLPDGELPYVELQLELEHKENPTLKDDGWTTVNLKLEPAEAASSAWYESWLFSNYYKTAGRVYDKFHKTMKPLKGSGSVFLHNSISEISAWDIWINDCPLREAAYNALKDVAKDCHGPGFYNDDKQGVSMFKLAAILDAGDVKGKSMKIKDGSYRRSGAHPAYNPNGYLGSDFDGTKETENRTIMNAIYHHEGLQKDPVNFPRATVKAQLDNYNDFYRFSRHYNYLWHDPNYVERQKNHNESLSLKNDSCRKNLKYEVFKVWIPLLDDLAHKSYHDDDDSNHDDDEDSDHDDDDGLNNGGLGFVRIKKNYNPYAVQAGNTGEDQVIYPGNKNLQVSAEKIKIDDFAYINKIQDQHKQKIQTKLGLKRGEAFVYRTTDGNLLHSKMINVGEKDVTQNSVEYTFVAVYVQDTV